MATRNNQYIDALFDKIDQLPIGTPEELARVLPLYIKASNDNGVVRNMSFAYIDNYDGRAFDNSLEDGVVAQVFQAGYRLKERVLRYAQVVVNKLN